MNIFRKSGFFGAVLAAMLLASCTTTETTDEAGNGAQQPATGADVSSVGSENVSVSAGDAGQPTISLDNMPLVVYFDFDQAVLKPDVREALDIAASVLKASGASIRLEGHADERGTREYNLALGERRAQAVKNYLGVQGVDKSKLEVISYGEEKPVEAASNEEAWSKNRRVELVR